MRPVDQARIDANWRAIAIGLDAPRPPLLERALRRLGVPAHVTRLIAATPALRRAWYVSIVLVAVVGLGAAEPGDHDSLFALLVLAPLVPVLGVGMAFGAESDPGYEVEMATPTRGVRLVAVRALTVLVVAIAVILVLSVLSPAARPLAAAWLLPALAVTSASVALMTVLSPRRAAAAAGAGWLAAVVVARIAVSDQLAVFGAVGQLVALGCAIVCITCIVARRAAFDRLAWTT